MQLCKPRQRGAASLLGSEESLPAMGVALAPGAGLLPLSLDRVALSS